MIKFDDFLNYYMQVGELDEQHIEELNKDMFSLVDSKSQDKYQHKTDIKKVVLAGHNLALTEDGNDEILLFDQNFAFQRRIKFSPTNHNARTLIILDFAYSEEE